MKNFAAIVLAAGKGTRMKSSMPKVLHEVAGKPMLFYPLRELRTLRPKKTVVVVGHEAERVKKEFHGERAEFVIQSPQLGTGHAVMCAMKKLRGFSGDVLILSGDVPLITSSTIKALFNVHKTRSDRKPVISFISVMLEDPSGYGRVVRDSAGRVKSIVEHKDLKPLHKGITEVNTGIYLVNSEFLGKNLGRLSTSNAQREYYLPELIHIAYSTGEKVKCLTHVDAEEVMGVNTRVELARSGAIMRKRILTSLMLDGTTIVDPGSTYVDFGVKCGKDTVIRPNVHLMGKTVIGDNCIVHEGSSIRDSVIEDGSHIKSYSVIESAKVSKKAVIGPFARLRPGSRIGEGAHIGNFVEIKNTVIGRGSKANHLSYIGDSTIGRGVNIGAGTITCNYDGVKKHRTTIEDNAFIGSDSQLVAPVTIGRNAYVASGSTITKDVPPGSLAISRVEQKIIKGWVKKKGLAKKKS
ncbi:MAG: bifunctional UDP-N-acetylglucosamine diphosphorylase/glucosamine-1-phosphate N-acetyltransferase GlmU [Thermodesulfobacteriota bacterium]